MKRFNDKEQWQQIKGYENYEISNWGRVRNTRTNRILKTKVHYKTGYVQVGLHKDGISKTFSVHRLVALHFIPNPNPYKDIQVNHKNEVKTDNYWLNLEWCDNEYNCNYGTKNEKVRKRTEQYSLDGEYIRTWNSLTEIEETLGYRKPNLSNCCKGVLPQAYGFIWRYE